MLNHDRVIREWLVSTHDVLSPPPRVQAALDQRAREQAAASQHWIDWSEEEMQRFLGIVDQQRLEFDAEDTHANVRLAIARYLQTTVAPAVADPSIIKLADRLRDARQHGTIMYNVERAKFVTIWDTKAGLPLLCPDDAREEAMRVQRRVVPAVLEALKQPGARAYYAVFTMPNPAPGKLLLGMRALFRRFNALLRKAKRDGSLPILGAYAVMEAPLAAGRDWHPHLNVILVTSGWFDYAKLRALWHWNVHVDRLQGSQASLESALREIIKYSVRAVPEKSHAKASSSVGLPRESGPLPVRGSQGATAAPETQEPPPLIEWPPDEGGFLEWWYAHKGFRRSRGYGCLYRLDDPESESLEGFQAIGSVRREGTRLVRRFVLLESIPGDKSSTESLLDRYRRAVQRLKGPPDEALRCLALAREAEQAWQRIQNQTH